MRPKNLIFYTNIAVVDSLLYLNFERNPKSESGSSGSS